MIADAYTIRGTATKLQENGFKFYGPGFYLSNQSTILVLASKEKRNFKKLWPSDTIFYLTCWYFVLLDNPIFSEIPIIVDTRESDYANISTRGKLSKDCPNIGLQATR